MALKLNMKTIIVIIALACFLFLSAINNVQAAIGDRRSANNGAGEVSTTQLDLEVVESAEGTTRSEEKTTVTVTEETGGLMKNLIVTPEDESSGLVKNVASATTNAMVSGATAAKNAADPDTIESVKNGESSIKEIVSTDLQTTVNEASGVQQAGTDDLSWTYDIMATGSQLAKISSDLSGVSVAESGLVGNGLSYSIDDIGSNPIEDTASATQELINQMEINCAWQVSAGGIKADDLVSSSFGDGNIFTHVQVIPNLLTESVVWVNGQFPKARQFSFTTYDIKLDGSFEVIETLTDKDIMPAQGENPYSNADATNVDTDEYDVYLTGSGTKGYPNEMGYRSQNGNSKTSGKTLLLVYRIVNPSNEEKLSLSVQKKFGYVPAPIIRSKLSGIWKGGLWAMLAECPTTNTELVKAFTEANNADIASRSAVSINCPTQNNPNNFIYLRGDDGKNNPATFQNEDSDFLLACGSSEGEPLLSDLSMTVEGTLPVTATGLFAEKDLLTGESEAGKIQIANTDEYDARYVSISVADLLPPRDTLVTVSADKIERFYTDLLSEGETWDRKYRLVFVSTLTYERSCGDLNAGNNVTAMPIVFMPSSDYSAVIYREVGGDPSKPSTVANTKKQCLELDRCSDVREISRMMDAKISHNMCADGAMTPAAAVPTPEWTPYPTSAPTTGPTPAPTDGPPTASPTPGFFFSENWEEGKCAGLAHVDITSASEYEVFVNGVEIGSSTQAGSSDLRYGWYPIEDTPEEVVIAVQAPANHIAGKLSGIIADVELCGHRYGSNMEWKCSDLEPSDDSWTNAGFDDSTWMNPRLMAADAICNELGCDHMEKIPMAIWPESCDGRRVRNAYCRITIASECTTCQAVDFARSAVPPLPEKFGTCVNPEILNVVTKVSSDASYDVFVGGKLIGFKPTDSAEVKTFQSQLSSMTDSIVIAVEASYENKDNDEIAFLADIDICGHVMKSDMNWKCASERPDASWKNVHYDDSEWADAKIVNGLNSNNDEIEGISGEAYGIWSSNKIPESTRRQLAYRKNDVTSAFCRVTIPNPLKATM